MWEGEFTTKSVQVTSIVGTVDALPANPLRVYVLISCLQAGIGLFVQFTDVPGTGNEVLLQQITTLELKAKDSGPLVASRIRVRAAGAGALINFIEVVKGQGSN